MIDYITFGANDVEASVRFYDAVLGVLGYTRDTDEDGWARYAPRDGGQMVFVSSPFDGRPASAGNGAMVAFKARSHEEVRAAHAAGLAQGGTDEGAPGLRPQYSPDFYGAYLRDPTGNKLAVVFQNGGDSEN